MAKRTGYMADAVVREWADKHAAEAAERGLTVPCACGRWMMTDLCSSVELCGAGREKHSAHRCSGDAMLADAILEAGAALRATEAGKDGAK